jgi:Arc/MetJ family transcription regulator
MLLEKLKDSGSNGYEPMIGHTLTHTLHCVRLRVEVISMATNLQIDDKLITKAVDLGHHRTKKAAVTQALINYILHLEQENILSLFGSIDYVEGYNYKNQRSRA